MNDLPKDPMTSLGEGAAAMHEIYRSYVTAGFTEAQALYLIGQLLAASARPQS